MTTLVQNPAPDFEARAVLPDGSFSNVHLSDYRGKYVVLFFYPLDFTFVCPTEIVAFSERIEEFEARNVLQQLPFTDYRRTVAGFLQHVTECA